jgi:hypothetical protein
VILTQLANEYPLQSRCSHRSLSSGHSLKLLKWSAIACQMNIPYKVYLFKYAYCFEAKFEADQVIIHHPAHEYISWGFLSSIIITWSKVWSSWRDYASSSKWIYLRRISFKYTYWFKTKFDIKEVIDDHMAHWYILTGFYSSMFIVLKQCLK